MGQVTNLRLSCYLVLLSIDSKTRWQDSRSFVTWPILVYCLNFSHDRKCISSDLQINHLFNNLFKLTSKITLSHSASPYRRNHFLVMKSPWLTCTDINQYDITPDEIKSYNFEGIYTWPVIIRMLHDLKFHFPLVVQPDFPAINSHHSIH